MSNFKLSTFEEFDQEIFFQFCKTASTETQQPASVNMWSDNWVTDNHTLPHVLLLINRFSETNGKFFILTDGDKIVGCSGVYISEFCSSLALAGCRLWIDKDYRNKLIAREWFLPAQKKWAIEHGCGAIAVTFNEYNKNIIETWKRIRPGETRSAREPKHIFYSNFNEVKYLVNIQYTKQWVAFETLNPTWDYDWNKIRS